MVTAKKLNNLKGENEIVHQAVLSYLPENATEFATEFFLVQPTVVYHNIVVHNTPSEQNTNQLSNIHH